MLQHLEKHSAHDLSLNRQRHLENCLRQLRWCRSSWRHDLRMLQHQPHTTARMLQHLHWCQRSWHCTPSSCTQPRMSTCCPLCCPQHRKAPRNRLRDLLWCQRSLRCTPPSCTQLWMSTCCTLRSPQHRKAPRNCQRHLPWCRKRLALHVTELRTPTAATEPVLHAPLSTAPLGA